MRLFNTLTRQIEDFTPQEPNIVKLYTCGPTVYDYLHIGNWTAYIRWDLLTRVLGFHDFKVNRVMNITDVGHLVSDADEGEDKLEKGARREDKSAWEIAQKYTDDFFHGMEQLNLLPAANYPRATEHIADQIALIKNLEDKGYTYQIDDGVYFDISKFPAYADFAGLNLDAQERSDRLKPNTQKRQSADFALWKFAPQNARRDMKWDSPWGVGFPGWHIECSAIALKYFGPTLDIHSGGIDHIPVHHTNEIAQSQAATGQKFSRFWLHSNFLLIDSQKISKSLNNGIRLDDLTDKGYDLMDFKLLVLQSHYRSEVSFSFESLEAARRRRQALQAAADLRWQPMETASPFDAKLFIESKNKLTAALDDDLNSPQALAEIYTFLDPILALHPTNQQHLTSYIGLFDKLFGLNFSYSSDITDDQKKLIADREQARKNQDWKVADELRQELEQQNLAVNDTPAGPVWHRLN